MLELQLQTFAAALLLLGSVPAQEPAAAPRPRTGLVLSGGGARGLAHIGVLLELDRMRVPVDCVAGTSMGAIVGGLFAYGMAPEDIERWVSELDWGYVLQDAPRRTDLAIRRKQEEYEFLVQLRLGVRDGSIALPKGVVQGQNLGILLDWLTRQAHDLRSFDDLPLPFRCVAADIADGSRVVCERGDLPLAMRASMSLPGIFAPVEWEGRLVVDGGILDNLPVAAARELGAQRLIAVDIGTPPLDREKITNLLAVTSQVLAVLSQRFIDEARRSLGGQDLLITPELGDISSADFGRAAELIAIGREWARRHAADLGRFAVSEAEYAAWRARQRRPARPEPLVREVRITTDSTLAEDLVRSRFTTKPGDRLDLARLQRDLEGVYGLDLFERVRLRVLRAGADGCDLEIQAIAKSWGPGYLRFSLDASTDFAADASFSLGVHHVLTGIGPLDAEWSTTLRAGTDTLLRSEWYQPVTASRDFFVAPSIAYRRYPVRTLVGGVTSELVVDGAGVAIDAGWHWREIAELRVGVERGRGDWDLETGVAPSGEDSFDFGGPRARFEVDTLDSSTFPSAGLRAVLGYDWNVEALGADADNQVARLSALVATTHWGQTFGAFTTAQVEIGGQTPIEDTYSIGGLFRVSGLGQVALGNAEGATVALLTYRRLGEGVFPVYLGGSLEAGGVWDGWDQVDHRSVILGGSLFAGLETPLGPVYLAFGMAEGGERAGYLTLGQIR